MNCRQNLNLLALAVGGFEEVGGYYRLRVTYYYYYDDDHDSTTATESTKILYFDPSLDPSSIHHPPTTMTMMIQRLGKEKGEEEKASTPNPKMNERHSDCCFHRRFILGLYVNLGECGFGGKNDSHFGAYYLCFPPFRVLCHLNKLT